MWAVWVRRVDMVSELKNTAVFWVDERAEVITGYGFVVFDCRSIT
jgi:hypothetical protein